MRGHQKNVLFLFTHQDQVLLLGKKAQILKKLKKILMKITDSEVNVNIKEIKKPELNANLVAENIAQQLVKRIAYRRAMKEQCNLR